MKIETAINKGKNDRNQRIFHRLARGKQGTG